MAFNFFELINATSIEDVEESLIKANQDGNLQTTDWRSGAPDLTNLKEDALIFWTLLGQCRENARNAINSLSSGSALTSLAYSHFNNVRSDAAYTKGLMIITGSSAVVPRTFQASECKVTDGTYVFYNEEQFTISNAIPYVTATFVAEATGAEYNIPSSSSLSFVGTEIGFSVRNPTYTYGISGSWITTIGADEESDSTLRQRNQTKYASFQTGDLTYDRVRNIALSASSDLTYVSVDDNNPRGPYSVNVYLSKDTETAPSSSVLAVQSILNNAFFGNSGSQRVTAYAATPVTFDRTIDIYYSKTANAPTVISSVEEAADEWITSIDIGGLNYYPFAGNNSAHINDLITKLNVIEGVEKITVLSSSTDITLSSNQKLVSPDDWNTLITYNALTLR